MKRVHGEVTLVAVPLLWHKEAIWTWAVELDALGICSASLNGSLISKELLFQNSPNFHQIVIWFPRHWHQFQPLSAWNIKLTLKIISFFENHFLFANLCHHRLCCCQTKDHLPNPISSVCYPPPHHPPLQQTNVIETIASSAQVSSEPTPSVSSVETAGGKIKPRLLFQPFLNLDVSGWCERPLSFVD